MIDKLLEIESRLLELRFAIGGQGHILFSGHMNEDELRPIIVSNQPFFIYLEEEPLGGRKTYRLKNIVEKDTVNKIACFVNDKRYVVQCLTTSKLGLFCTEPYLSFQTKLNLKYTN